MSSNFLIDDNEYNFLKRLGIERKNFGVYNNKWSGNGKVCRISIVLD
jgi:hypothetical protein